MSQKQAIGRSGRTRSADVEWIGGLVSMPAAVAAEGEHERYRPEGLCWMGADGHVLGMALERPGELLPMACEHLQQAIEQPLYGPPHVPTRIRVASPELAEVLRSGRPEIDIVCAPTPELDDMMALMGEHLEGFDAGPQSFLSPGIEAEAMAGLFAAAAALYRAKPWKLVPDDVSPFAVTIEQLGVRDAALAVIVHEGRDFALMLFPSLDDFDLYLDAAELISLGEDPEVPPHLVLNFERGAELTPELRKEIADHQWEVAGSAAYPGLVAADADLLIRPPTAREVTLMAAIASALVAVLVEKKALREARQRGVALSRMLTVPSHEGEIEVALLAPYDHRPIEISPVHPLIAELLALDDAGDGLDPDARAPLEDELLAGFAASPEGQDVDDLEAPRLLMDIAANALGMSIAEMEPFTLREILFHFIPLSVSIEASKARAVIEANRAFFRFLGREYGLAQAESCARVLGHNAIIRLELELSDDTNFGVAKSIVMAGRDAGFDVDTPEGLEAWMDVVQNEPLPLPHGPPPAAKKTAREKKNKRKAERRARKRNR
ncbi:MAG: hypothetical protein WD928_16425 [Gammaproteobacteria bacterium]